MNQFFTIGVSKKVVFDKISLFSSYLAGKRSGDYVDYDRVAVHDLDIPLLDCLSDDASSELATALGCRLKEFTIEGDVMRFVIVNPAYQAPLNGSNMVMPDNGLLLKLMESYIESVTIHRWLRIVGYQFGEGARQAYDAAAEVAAGKLASLKEALTPSEPPVADPWSPSIRVARARSMPPM